MARPDFKISGSSAVLRWRRSVAALALLLLAHSGPDSAPADSPAEAKAGTTTFSISSFAVGGDFATLSWRGGSAPYQVQGADSPAGPFMNLGPPIDATSTNVMVSGSSGFFRVVSEQTARYRVVFDAVWSSATHPAAYPFGAHWSGLVGGVHGPDAVFWEVGQPASIGIKNMAEFGSKTALLAEVDAAIQAGFAGWTLSGPGIGSGSGSASLDFVVSRDCPLVSLTSMIAPSPDWFMGVSGLSLLQDGGWVESKVVSVPLYDAGTDAGSSYASPNQAESPAKPVSQIVGFPALVEGELVPFGTLTFTRQRD